jgi:hypothetical protein
MNKAPPATQIDAETEQSTVRKRKQNTHYRWMGNRQKAYRLRRTILKKMQELERLDNNARILFVVSMGNAKKPETPLMAYATAGTISGPAVKMLEYVTHTTGLAAMIEETEQVSCPKNMCKK